MGPFLPVASVALIISEVALSNFEVAKALASTKQPDRLKVVDFIQVQYGNVNVVEHVANFCFWSPIFEMLSV